MGTIPTLVTVESNCGSSTRFPSTFIFSLKLCLIFLVKFLRLCYT